MPGLVEDRDRKMDLNTAETRGDRADLKNLAKPQMGVDDLKGKFARPTKDIFGVVGK